MRNVQRMVMALGLGALAVGCGESPAVAAPVVPLGPLQVTVDARDAAVGKIHNHVTIPVHAGELTLVYPKWIPGEHGPTGPIAELVGLRVSSGGKPIAWRRNQEEMYEIAFTVPANATSVEVDFDSLRTGAGQFSGAAASTARYVDVVWNHAVLYPKGARASAVAVDASVKLPQGWTYATALRTRSASDGSATFERVSLETLVDSPVLSGAHLKTYDLGVQRGARHSLTAVGENAESVVAAPEQIEAWKNLVVEANALFGARHYDEYRFLVLTSDSVPWYGLEHHASSENYVKERALTDGDLRRVFATLLPHEYAHSWNGKYRRPRGLATPSYQEPMRGDLLWVYEGLTEYLGWVLSARSGLASPDDAKYTLMRSIVNVDNAGRKWRPLADTTAAAQILYDAPESYGGLRRGVDFYAEGLLLWLEVDVQIRQKTGGARSLDDFCQRFHGGKDGSPEVRPYDLDEVVKTLAAVAPVDWRAFFDQRVYAVAPEVPLGGVTGAGYRVAVTEKKPELLGLREKAFKFSSYGDSLGINLNEENVVVDVNDGSPAAKAGMAPRMKVLAADGRKLSGETLAEALARAKTSPRPIELLVELDGWYRTLPVDYHGGEHHRVVERDPSKPDLLAAILARKAGPAPQQ